MYYLIHQNGDLTEISGYAFTLPRALDAASKRIGLTALAVDAEVVGTNVIDPNTLQVISKTSGPAFPCYVVIPRGSTFGKNDPFCREGQMTLIAQDYDVMPIATMLCRRNGQIYGAGQVVLRSENRHLPSDGDDDDAAETFPGTDPKPAPSGPRIPIPTTRIKRS